VVKISLIGGFRLNGVSGSAEYSNSIHNFMGFPISGHTDSNAQAVCLFVWDYTTKMWIPMSQP
jgi:hypothetical protein